MTDLAADPKKTGPTKTGESKLSRDEAACIRREASPVDRPPRVRKRDRGWTIADALDPAVVDRLREAAQSS